MVIKRYQHAEAPEWMRTIAGERQLRRDDAGGSAWLVGHAVQSSNSSSSCIHMHGRPRARRHVSQDVSM